MGKRGLVIGGCGVGIVVVGVGGLLRIFGVEIVCVWVIGGILGRGIGGGIFVGKKCWGGFSCLNI